MKRCTVGVAAAILFIARSASAQEAQHVALELGIVEGLGMPYASVGVVVAPWSIRVSGGADRLGGCSSCAVALDAQQVNVGRVFREEGNAKHTIGMMWGHFRVPRYIGGSGDRLVSGQYLGVAYNFQAKGFFIEAGPAWGAKNPVASAVLGDGPLTRIYGQVGFVYRFGKQYDD